MKIEDRYEILEKIASGSFATVYRARDNELAREVAIKQVHSHFLDNPKQLDRFWEEAQLLASLQHPNIVTIYDIVRSRGWLIMELMQTTLSERQQGRPLDLVSLRTTLAHSLRALSFLHEHGIVHGDIKPSNLMVDRRKRIKIGDFGLARRVSNAEGSLVKGSAKYMAPEVVTEEFGDVGPQSDLYSLGFTAYELLCGEHFDSLFPGLSAFGRDEQVAWMMWHAAPDRKLPEIHRVLDGVPDDLRNVIQKLTAKPQAARYKTATEALSDLNIDLKIVKTGDDPAPEPTQAKKDNRRVMVILAFIASMTLSLAMLFYPGPQPTRPEEGTQVGIVRDLSSENSSMVLVDDATGSAEKIIFPAKPSIFLTNSQKNILLEEIEPGDRVQIRPHKESKGGVQFVVSRPSLSLGRLIRSDISNDLLILQVDEGPHRGEMKVRFLERTKITINGDPARILDFREGDRLQVRHLPDLEEDYRHIADEIQVARILNETGTVEFFDHPRKRISFRVGHGPQSVLRNLPFSETAEVTLQDGNPRDPKALEPGDIRENDRIEARFDSELHKIKLTRNDLTSGVILELELNRFEFSSDTGKTLRVQVPEVVEVRINNDAASFADLRKFDVARITYEKISDSEIRAVTIDTTRPIKHDRMAVVVGVQNYKDRAISRSEFAIDDARLLGDVLSKRYAFAPEYLKVLTDPNRETFERDLRYIASTANADTQVFVFLFCNGYLTADGTPVLALVDCEFSRLAETGFPLKKVVEILGESASRENLLLVDTSPLLNGEDARLVCSSRELIEKAGIGAPKLIRIASTDLGERSATFGDKKQGVFAWHLAQGFRGPADKDRDLRITPEELFGFLEREHAATTGENRRTPVKVVSQ